MGFTDKVVLITGASGGIGASCAEYFATKLGASVALVGRNPKKFEKVLKNIKDSGVKKEPLVIIADISTDAERIISETIAKFQRLDVLVNNAAFSIKGTIETQTLEEHNAIFATGVTGTLQVTQLAVPHLIKSKGNIVNISSVGSFRPSIGYLSYSMSKAALDQFTRCVALELADKGVRVNSVNPGIVDTDFHVTNGLDPKDYPATLQYMNTQHPLGKVATTDDVVQAILFFADNSKASHITGTCLPVDGGLAIKNPFN